VALTYLDHAATTPMRPAAVDAMLPFLTERFANPSGSHRFARDARRAIDEARDSIAERLGVRPGEVVFTGCGTESDNTVVAGVNGVAVCPAVEHHAVLHPVEARGGRVVGVDASGHVDLDLLADALDDQVGLVSVMAVNNEVGTSPIWQPSPASSASGRPVRCCTPTRSSRCAGSMYARSRGSSI
jgi:cysteine desulfurase